MSGNSVFAQAAPAMDRRRARTRQALLQAFTSLMFERRYDGFGVAELIERANVGRSTYYEHFGSKEALLRASMAPMLTVLADAGAGTLADPGTLRWVIEHFWENRRLGRVVFAPPLRALIERQLAELIEARLTPGNRLAALQIAAAQIGAIDAWVSAGTSVSVEAMIAAISATSRLAA